jgi:hypothetical protein
MNQRQKELIRQKNIISEMKYFEKKYLNEDVTYQLTPSDESGKYIVKAKEDDLPPRDLNDEENKIFGGKPLSQDQALIKIQNLLQNKSK